MEGQLIPFTVADVHEPDVIHGFSFTKPDAGTWSRDNVSYMCHIQYKLLKSPLSLTIWCSILISYNAKCIWCHYKW